MTHDWMDQAMKLVRLGQQMSEEIQEIIGGSTMESNSPWKEAAPYDGEPIQTDLTEQEAEEILEALYEVTPPMDAAGVDSVAVLLPVDRDWAASFVHNIRRQERRLAEARLRARLGNMFTPSYVDDLAEAVNPPETPADLQPRHHHDEWCAPDCPLPTGDVGTPESQA